MPDRFEIEQLVIDDTFISYCYRRNLADVAYWENYLAAHPEEAGTLAEARELVLGISLMLMEAHEHADVSEREGLSLYGRPRRNIWKTLAVAASVAVIVVSTFFFIRNRSRPELATAERSHVFTTALAEKKRVRLPDSSTVLLNAGSTLQVSRDFGGQDRSVSLTGEALFDVTHDARLPFIVKVEGYEVKVLGTVFNVKAYPGEKKSETSLISGKVEIHMKHTDPGYKILLPEEKFVFSEDISTVPSSSPSPVASPPKISIMPLSYNRNQVNIETAWSQNRLIFENESFEDISKKLERWFDVQIIFEDKIARQYSFTATFEKENIYQVMKALQASYGFTYSINGKEIKISHQSRIVK